MYFDDHGIPHFHVITVTEQRVSVAIESLTIIAGSAKSRDISEALEWARSNKRLLRAKWREFSEE